MKADLLKQIEEKEKRKERERLMIQEIEKKEDERIRKQ